MLQTLLAELPLSFPVPILIVLHRHAESQDVLLRLLRSPGMPAVVDPFDKDPLFNGAIYLGPANYHMMLEGDTICLNTDEPVNNARPSIDVLFASSARTFGARSVGVVLSGASGDGASGAKKIKAAGGTVVIQDPSTAQSETLPEMALANVPNAHVLQATEIANFLSELFIKKNGEIK